MRLLERLIFRDAGQLFVRANERGHLVAERLPESVFNQQLERAYLRRVGVKDNVPAGDERLDFFQPETLENAAQVSHGDVATANVYRPQKRKQSARRFT